MTAASNDATRDFEPDEISPEAWERRERSAGAGSFRAVKAQYAARRTPMQRIADRLTHAASSPAFLLGHLAWFVVWIVANSGVAGMRPFDPFPYGLLTLALSMEAIVLTIFVLMTQGREAAVAELREEITLRVNLRVEEEVTKTLQLVTGLYARLGYPIGDEAELREMLRPLDPEAIEAQLAREIAADPRAPTTAPTDWDGAERRRAPR